MADFKVVHRVDASSKGELGLTWEASCPLLFEAMQISRNTNTGEAYLQGKLLNISNQTIQSFKALITVEYEDGNTETAEFKPLDADILAGAIYKLEPVLLKQGDASRVLSRIENVKLVDGKWESAASPTAIPEPQPIGLSEEATQERYEEIWKPLKSTIPFHERKKFAANRLEEHNGWWLCPCGQVNVGKGACAKCGASLDVLQKPDAEDEEALAAAAKKRKECEAQKAEEGAAKRKRLTTLAIKAGAALLAVGVLVVAILWFTVLHPRFEYTSAINLYDSGNYSEAYNKFSSLGDYEQSKDWAEKSLYRLNLSEAEKQYQAGDLLGALEAYEGIGNAEAYIEPVLYSMANYVKEHTSKDDQLTIEYLNALRRYDYKNSDFLLGLVYPWSYEFALTSSNAFKENEEQWTTVSELDPKKGSGYRDSGVLLVRAKCENPEGRRDLELTWETRKAGSVFASENGKWSKGGQTGSKGKGPHEAKVWGDNKIYSFPFPDLYCDAWRVTVTDPITKEVLFAGEIYQH